MFTCPHCKNGLFTGARTDIKFSNGSGSGTIICSHCRAILHLEITTLREPDVKLLERTKLQLKKALTYCTMCKDAIIVGSEATHKCITNVEGE